MFEPIVNSVLISNILVHAGLVIGVLLLFLYYVTKKDSRISHHLQTIGGPPSYPVVGVVLSLLVPHEKLIPLAQGWVAQYGGCFSAWIGNIPYVLMASPESVEKMLSSPTHINKGKDYETFLEPWLGTGLLTARREKWYQRRKLLTPTFHFKILEDFVPIFNDQATILTEMLARQLQLSDTFDICPFISKCSLDIICETAMGEKINAQIGGEEDYVKTVCGMTDMVLIKGLNPIYRNEYVWNLAGFGKLEAEYLKRLHKFTDKMISYRKAERKRKQIVAKYHAGPHSDQSLDSCVGIKTRKAFLDLLLDLQESETQLTDADIREEVDTFMFEGHDTTGANLDWTILMLACNPECQRLVHEELDRVFGNDSSRDITTADIKEMKYLDCCIKEALRMFPSVPFFIRRLDEDLPLDEKSIVPKGTSVLISPYLMHRNPKVFSNPDQFQPERFSIENSAGRHPYAYIPFSAGHRNCIGQKFAVLEEKVVLASILRKFRIEAVDTVESVVPVPDVILRPKHGIKVKLVKRI